MAICITTNPQSWRELAQVCVGIQKKSIPEEYLLSEYQLPPKDRRNVLDVPSESGILTAEELQITEQDASGLLERYKSGHWTVKQVVKAFLKRATIIHQLVQNLQVTQEVVVILISMSWISKDQFRYRISR